MARRENYLNNLVTNSMSSRTNFSSKKKAFDKQNPRLGLRKAEIRTDDGTENT